MENLNVVLILKSGGDFAFRDADLLASRISQWYIDEQRPKVYCYTDIVRSQSVFKHITLIPHPNPEWGGWWSKMILFSPQLEPLRPFLYLDLDSAVVGQMNSILPCPKPEDFVMLKDFHAPTRPASGMMWIPAKSSKVSLIWKLWSANPLGIVKQFRGDQDFIRAITRPDSFWQDLAKDKVFSFKPSRTQWLTELPKGAEVICFHGKPRPRQALGVPWVEKYIETGLAPVEPPVSPIPFIEDRKRWDAKATGIRCWFSLLCPTRGRPEMAKAFVNSVYAKAKWPEKVETLLYVDSDDPFLSQYVSMMEDSPAKIIVGPSEGVGKAWNCLAKASSGEYLMMANDDLIYESKEWDWLLLQELLKYPDQIILGWANDGINGAKHCAFPIIGRKWFEELGQFVEEKYAFFRHDTDLWEVGKQIGNDARAIYIGRVTINHLHHSTGKTKADDTTWRNRKNDQNKRDEKTYNAVESVVERRAKGSRLRRAINESRHYHAKEFKAIIEGKKVALVGPSPHLTHKGIGSLIDTYDVVCRVNEILPIGLEHDYGSRSDVLFYGCNRNNLPNFNNTMNKLGKESPEALSKIKFFMASQRRYDSINLFAMEGFLRTLHQMTPQVTIGIISMPYWSFWQRWIGTHPNTGILALLMLANENPKELFLTGFSFYAQGLKPSQRHHAAYIKYGGDVAYNKTVVTKGHVQDVQSKWFKEQFLPIYGKNVVVDSYLNDYLGLGHHRVVPLKDAVIEAPIIEEGEANVGQEETL